MSFTLGRVVVTRNCLNYATEHNVDLTDLLFRHGARDWGDLCKADKMLNDQAAEEDGRVLSAYVVNGQKFYICTEWDRSYTTIMLAQDY